MKGWGRWVPVGAVGVFAALFLALGRELSLSELAETFDPPVTKSCLNHRLRKLMELAGNL